MPAVYVKTSLFTEEVSQLKKEFPYYRIYTREHFEDSLDPDALWSQVEVFFGGELNRQQLNKTPNLRWIHTPSANVGHLPMDAITERENILVTVTPDQYWGHVGEWAIASYYAFSKMLFDFKDLDDEESILNRKEEVWENNKKIFLLIGVVPESTEILQKMKENGLITWGVNETGSFHPFCDKVFSFEELNALLPSVDVVCFFGRKGGVENYYLTKEHLELMREGVILLLFTYKKRVDAHVLKQLMYKKKFKGVMLDTQDRELYKLFEKERAGSPLLLTHHVSIYPLKKTTQSFRLFRHNLRQFLHENFQDMEKIITGRRG